MSELGAQSFFVYKDLQGKTVIVNRLEDVPFAQRSSMKTVHMPIETAAGAAKEGARAVQDLVEQAVAGALPGPSGVVGRSGATSGDGAQSAPWHGPSLLVGAAGGGVVTVVTVVMLFTRMRWLKITLLMALLALGVSFYLGWIRCQAGLGDGILISPTTLIEDAHRVNKAARYASEKQERLLEQIQAEPGTTARPRRTTGSD